MKLIEQEIPGFFLIESEPVFDERGVFRRNFCRSTLASVGIEFDPIQGNISENTHKHTLRGFHYQRAPYTEGKILTCLTGGIFNVVVDLRHDSPTYMFHQSVIISDTSRVSLLVPPGCANAFLTLHDSTIVHYYMSAEFVPDRYAGFRFDDPAFGVIWPEAPAVISDRDLNHPAFKVE